MKKKLFAYLIEFNPSSDNPSYDIRYYGREVKLESTGRFRMIRCEEKDTYIDDDICEHCAGSGKIK